MIKLPESLTYVGTADKDLTLFEGQYELPNGMLYNSYIIFDEKIAVMDTCDSRKIEEWISNVKNALGDKTPDYLVIHHLEPDHSAGILELHRLYPGMKLVGNSMTFRLLPQFFEEDLSGLYEEVDDGSELSLGEHTLKFFKAPMVHWPEVMVSYDQKDKVLFAADAFGKFGIEEDTEDWACEARRYYFNIVGKYGMNVQMLLGKVRDLEIKVICPLHGPVLDGDLGYYTGLYNTWSSYTPEDEGIFIACASIHGHTMQAAEYLEKKLRKMSGGDVKVVLTDLCRSDWAEAVEDAFRYDRMVLMSSSYNAGLFPPMENFLHHLAGDNYCKRKVAIVQNGTWAPSAAASMKKILEPLKDITLVGDVITIKTRMTDENAAQLDRLAEQLLG